jgi:ribosome-associated protein
VKIVGQLALTKTPMGASVGTAAARSRNPAIAGISPARARELTKPGSAASSAITITRAFGDMKATLSSGPDVDSAAVPREVPITSETIKLGQLLKLAGLIGSGADAKDLLADEAVLVNGQPEVRRGRQLQVGDTVRVGDEVLELVSS